MFSLRIVSTSHYQADPLADLDVLYSSFRSTAVRKVPVLRVFGATPAGQKTCMHVHGVFPYLYAPYDGTQPVDSYLRRFAASLDKAINVANNSQANIQHVFKVSLVAGIPMYGYHAEEQQFLKIYLYNPSTVRKTADLLLGGAVMNKSFQPHESHIPFPLQLFMDYNLYGMNMINVAAVKFRRKKADTDRKQHRSRTPERGEGSGDVSVEGGSPLFSRNTPSSSSSTTTNTPSLAHWDMEHIQSDLLLPDHVERQSTCELEVDVIAADILNRKEVTDNMGKNPGLAAIWEDERQRRRDVGQPSQITPQQSQEHDQVEVSTSERELLDRFREILQQQQALRRSESEESEMSIEESTLSPEDISCIPASQLEDHSQSASNQDSQDSQQSSQGTVVLGEEEGDEDGEGVVISLESIQRVVSFSQSFSRPGSQPSSSSTPQEGEAADQTLIDVLAALAEESSPSASQRCAAQVEALEDRDSVVGQGVAVPPDSDALQEDLEETLHMSQTLPEDSEDYNTDGLEATWDGSPNQQLKDRFLVDSHEARNDDEDDDNDDDLIPQLDGASDQKPASKKPGKKRLGVRGPVLSTHTAGARQRRRSSQGGVGDALKGQTPPPASCPTDSSANSCEQSSKAHSLGTPSTCSPKFSQSSGVDVEDTDTVSCASTAKIPQESSQGTDTCSSQKQATDSCCPLSSKYSCAVSLQPFTSSDSISSGPQLSSQKTEEDSDDDSDDNIPLGQIERLHKQTSSLPPVTTTSSEEKALSPGKEDTVSMEVCGKDSESCPLQEGNMDCSGGSSSNSSGCVVRMEKVDKLSRPKKLALSLNKLRHLSHDNGISSLLPVPSPPSSPCCFTIPLPTPVYKRLKMRGVFTDTRHEVQYVRVRPIDICQTDLQKIGQEILRLTRLTQKEFNHLGIAVDRCEDEEGTVTEKEASASGQPGEVKIFPVPRDKASSSSMEGVGKSRRGKHRRLMGPKCKRKTAGSSGRDKISCTDPQTAGMSDHQQEISGDSVHTPVSESGAAPMHTPSTSVTCTDAAVSVASDDGRNAFGWQPLVTDCLSSVKGDDPCQKRLTCKCPGFSSADDKEVTVSIDSHRQGDSSSHLEDCSLASPSSVRACKCERLPSSNQCSCGASPWSPPVSTASPSSVSASVPVSSSPCQKDSGGSPSCSQSHSDLCSGGDRDQRDTTSSTTQDSRSGSPHFASTNISTSGVGTNDGLPLSQQRHCSSQSGSSSIPSWAVSVTSDLSHLPLSHSNPVTTSACSQQETLPTTSVCAVVCSRSPVHQSQHSAGSKQVPECCPRGDQGSSSPTPESVQTAGTFTCLQGSADSISSPVHQQELPKNLQLALDAVCLETSRNSMLPDRQNDDKNAVKNTDLDEKAETESEHLIQNSDVQVNSSTSDNDLCGKSQGKTDRRNSNSGSSSKMPLEVDSKDLPFIPPMRHSAVRLWSLGDSDSESEVSDDSSDDYCPTKAQKKKRKRKGSKQQTKTGIKRPKWSSVNNSTHSNSRCIGHDGENKHARKKKNARNKGKENMQELIEGVHYIVVGKFKGHRIMLVKLERVKVNLNERVKVSDCWGKKVSDLRENKAEAGAKAKPRLLGPRCRRLANGVSASDPSLVHIPKQEEPAASSDSESDTSPVPDRNANSPVLSENEPGACEELTEKPDGPQQKNETVNTEELHLKGMLNADKLREQDDAVNIKKLQQCSSYVNIEKLEKQYIDELQRQNGHVKTVELKQMNGNVDGDKEVEQLDSGKNEDLLQPDKITNGDTIQDTSKKEEKLPEKDIVEISRLQLGELVARQRKRKKGLSRVSSAPCNLKSTAGKESKSAGEGMVEHPPEDFQTHDLSTESGQTVGKVAKSAGKNQAARRRSSSSSLACVMVISDDGESSQEGNSGMHSPSAMDMDTDSRMAASESTSLTQSPVPKTDQQSDLPFTISEHSQDADCSSLPQSNPDSTSSSPAFPRMALTCTESDDKHESLTQTSPAVRLTNKEVCEGEILSSTVFCFQAVCDKVKEVRSCQRAMDGSSDSSDWQDSLDAAQPTKDENNSQSLSFSFKDKLQSGENLTADMDKEKLKKQKKLSPNQRLGVAFLPKRRRKGKMKNGKMKSEAGTGSTKVMDSLSLLHMATLASLDAEAGSKQDLKFPCTPWRLGSSKTDEKENHNTITLQRSTDNSSPWKTSICSTGDNEAKYDTSTGVEFTLNPEKGPDHSDSQVMENNTRTGEEPSNSQNQNLAHPIANMTAGIEHKGRDGENSSEETDDYQISECAESLKEEKPRNSANAKKKVISSENSEASTSRESESRSDHKVEEKNTGSVRRRSNKVQPPLYEDSDEKTDDYTGKMSMKRSASIKQLSGYRKRKIKGNPTVQKPDKSKNKVLDSLDVLHMATLASLGTDPPPLVHDDTMPRYSGSVWDHNKDYEESLIKMSYTSPVHSDLADLSPPIPLSPEDLSKVNLSTIQKQRAMPCRAKVDEAKGTRLVCMAQVRAENAAERASRRFVPISSPNQQVNGAARGLVQDVKHPGLKSSSVLCRTAIRSAAQPGSVKSPHAPSTSVHAAVGSQTLSSSCQTAQPTIPNPEKLPTPSIPWHHPLHVVTDGAAWKEQMPRDKFNSRNPSLGDGALPSKTHHSSYSMRGENRHSSLSSSSDTPQPAVCLKSPPFSAGMHREIRNVQPSPIASMNSAVDITSPRSLQSHGSSLRRPSVSYGPLGEIHNHLGSRPLPFTSLAQMYAQRDRGNERSPSISGEASGVYDQSGEKSPGCLQPGMKRMNNAYPSRSGFHGDSYLTTPPSSSQSSGGPFSWSSQSPSSRRESGEVLHCSTKSPPVSTFSPRDLHTMAPQPSPSMAPQPSPSLAPQPSPSGIKFHWSRSVDSIEGREIRSQKTEMRSQRDEEVKRQRIGEARSQRDREIRSQRDAEIRSSIEDPMMVEKTVSDSCGLPTSTPTKWLSDISNMAAANQQGKPNTSSQQTPPPSHYSPRLSRTEMVISQMFNLNSSSYKPMQMPSPEFANSVPGDRWQETPVSTVTSCSKSPGKGSPRGRLLENTRPGKTELWHQQSRRRSIGDYMQEMIETAYAKVSPGKPPCSWSEVPREDCSYPVRSEEGDRTHAMSVNGLTSSALDLTTCSGKFQNTGLYMSGSLSAQRPHTTRVTEMCSSASIDVPSGYAAVSVQSMASSSYHTSVPSLAADTATVMSCTSSVLPVSSSTASHPTWTSIKTDDFENITDDEDEEVIPSSQGYSTNAYRFPGFRRLSSISSSWTPYTLHNPHTLAAVSKTPSQTSKDVSGGGSVMETLSGHSYSSSMYGYSKGLYSQCNGVSQSSKVNCEQGLGPAEASQDPGRESVTQRLERGEYSVVSSLGTPWRESQPPASASTTLMSQFEPITDSEEEEDNTPKVTPHSHMRMSQYLNSSSSSAAFTGSSFFPAHSGMMASTAYSSASTSAIGLVSTSVHPPLHYKPPLPSSLLNRQDSGNSSASTREIGRSFLTIRSYSLDQPLSPSEGVAGGVDSLSNVNNDNMKRSVLVCGEDGDDSEPEDVGGRKRRKKAGPSPSDKPSASHPGPRREEGEKQEDDSDNMGQSGWPRNPEGTAGPVEMREASRHVLCPKAPPPSRRSVEASAASVGLSVEPTQPAFCSHPPDLPDAPRELGGRVLRLPTNMVKELEELPPPGEGGRGLGAWRALKVADSPLLFSQQQQRPSTSSSSSSSLSLHSEPQLRFALAGDHPCVITPVRPPPSCSRVAAWLKETLQKMSPSCGKTQLKSPERGEEAWGREGETSMPLDIDVPVEEEVGVSRDSDGEDEEEEDSMFTRLRDRTMKPVQSTSRKVAGSDEDRLHGSSTPKRQRLDEEGIIRHSTPVGRRSSSDLFDLTCTPISAGRKGESSGGQGETTDSGFVTPKHPPLRRLSTNTQAALTKAMLTADQRQQSFEGEVSQIDAPTPMNTHGFKVTQQNLQNAKALHKHQFLTVLSMELHADSRGDLMPDPEVDNIRVVFYAVFDDIPPERGRRNMTGAIVVDRESCRAQGVRDRWQPSTSAGTGGGAGSKRLLFEKCAVEEELDVVYVESELELLEHFAQLIVRLDPDILLGFEVQQMSWGFLLQRAAQLSVNLCSQIARIHGSKQGNRFSAEKDEWGADHTSEIHIEGRIVLNLWRLLRHEVTLNIYSYENCAFHILHHRLPAYTPRSLTSWYNHRTHLHAWRVVDYYTQRVRGQLAMMDQLDLIGKTSEFARVFGIEFYDVLSRGTQYRVESMMLRLAKPLNFIPVSPSVQQRARQKAAECIPLTLEPKSRVYTEPMVVLDFQSLYPSIMIAYNYCFSTCLGRLEQLAHASEGPLEFGCTSLSVTPEILKKIRKHVTISPNGCVFVTGKVRRGVLPMMVEEILKTRLMVKKSMKDYKDDKSLHRMLNARQLGLKLIANTTYGYTGASFSGRMPCIEVGDSIVRKARESLERAIHLVKDTAHWRAEVVYGDTDSLFIRLPGRSKDEAFVLGQEIADAVTNMFPKPMKLKFEKVYLPCALQTKKRYVGFMYETRDQQEAVFDAKGIETVRRDNCGVVSKVLERCIKILFTQRDVSQVRGYLHRQLTKMLAGRVGLQDFVFAKEYRGMMGYKPSACVPALEIARRRLRTDRRAEPRVGERVPYVIVHGSPGLPLIQLVRQPRDLLRDPSLRINVTYYISKQVLPPLNRLLSLVGVSVFQWYNDMPKVIRLSPHVAPAATAQHSKQGTISQYFVTSDCLVCERQTKEAVCASCRQDPQLVTLTLASRSASYEALQHRLAQVCQTCMGVQDSTPPCVSLDCPVLFRRHLATLDLARADLHRDALLKLTF
ncbi:hypothetical protein ACOMHN_043166 [Nucella lapillus]